MEQNFFFFFPAHQKNGWCSLVYLVSQDYFLWAHQFFHSFRRRETATRREKIEEPKIKSYSVLHRTKEVIRLSLYPFVSSREKKVQYQPPRTKIPRASTPIEMLNIEYYRRLLKESSLTVGQVEGLLKYFESALTLKQSSTVPLTENITVISHDHGRDRRNERVIDKKELQAAIKYGIKTAANPGRDGTQRWRYTYNGVVYVTDSTSKHEITSWRVNDTENAVPADRFGLKAGPYSSHIILIVDCSGSMRKQDVPGFKTRTAAVYECLAREFVEPQLALLSSKTSSADNGTSVVSVIEMSSEATIVLQQVPIDEALLTFLRERKDSYARSHGNYLPALESLRELMLVDLKRQVQLMAVFLSDGAPSDHGFMQCQHGVYGKKHLKGGDNRDEGREAGTANKSFWSVLPVATVAKLSVNLWASNVWNWSRPWGMSLVGIGYDCIQWLSVLLMKTIRY